MAKGLRNRPFNDAFDFDQVHRDCSILNDETKEFDFMDHEVTFQRLNEEVVITEYLKGFTDAFKVNCGVIIGCNGHIVHIDK